MLDRAGARDRQHDLAALEQPCQGDLAKPGGPVADAAEAHDATPGQIALAWLLQRSEVMLPIPGTGSVDHLEENVGAAGLELTPDEVAQIDGAAAPA